MTNLLEASIEQAGYTSRKKVLTDVFLEVRKGELVGLIGANGAGKSTAIKAILGLSEDFKGHIAWNHCSFAYIPEHPSFYEELTLWEHLDLISTLHGIEESEFAHRAQSLLQTFSLDQVKHELPVTFSKGMQQKLMLIQAFLSKPDMYLMNRLSALIRYRRNALWTCLRLKKNAEPEFLCARMYSIPRKKSVTGFI
ncbi:hypothetical protein BASU183_15235 [Bacillus subtilis]